MKSTTRGKLFISILFFFILSLYSFPPVLGAENQADFAFDYQEKELQDFYTKLDGEWTFFESSLLTPKEALEQSQAGKGQVVKLPSSFQTQIGEKNAYGTYVTTIKVPNDFIGKALAVHIPYEYSAYTLFIDQVEVAKNGTVGFDELTHITEMAPKTGYFIAQSNEIQVTIQSSSFSHIRGGIENSIVFGEATTVTQKFMNKVHLDLFVTSTLLIMGLFTLSFVSFRKEEMTFMVFGAFCLVIAFRVLFAEPFYYTILFPEFPWVLGTRLEYILTVLGSWIFVVLMWRWHSEEFSKKVLLFLTAVHFSLVIIITFTQPVFFQALFFKVFYLTIPTFIYIIYLTYKGIRNNNSKAKVNSYGIALIFIAFFNDFAMGNGWYQFYTLMLPATGIYVLLHMLQMSRDFAHMTRNREKLNRELLTLNASLDEQVHHRTLELQEANKLLKAQATIDSLTGIPNRRSFNDFMNQAFRKANQQHTPLAILMLDIDEFKKYNDHFGHTKGDWLLQEVSKVISYQLQPDTFFARYGGEEFAIILPEKTYEEAVVVAEQARKVVEESKFDHPKGKSGIVTFSIGVAVMTSETTYATELELIDAADQRLYKAKRNGRNQVM